MKLSLALAFAFALVVAVPVAARAQCPDGSLPPCGRRTVVRRSPDLSDRQAAARGLMAARLRALRVGSFTEAARLACAALTVLPESLAAWPQPPGCTVYSETPRGAAGPLGVILEALGQGLGRLGRISSFQPEAARPVGPTSALGEMTLVWAQVWGIRCSETSCDTTRSQASVRTFTLTTRDSVRVVSFISSQAVRDAMIEVLEQRLGHALELARGSVVAYRQSFATTFPIPSTLVSAKLESAPLEQALGTFATPDLHFVVDAPARRVRVTALIRERPWASALGDVLDAFGLVAVQEDERTIRVRLAR